MVLHWQETTSCPPSTFCLRPTTPTAVNSSHRIISQPVEQADSPSNHELCLFRTTNYPNGSSAMHYRCIVSTQPITDTHISITINILSGCQGLENVDVTIFLRIVGRSIDYYVINHQLRSILWAAGHLPEAFDGVTTVNHEGELDVHMTNFPGLGGVLANNFIKRTTSAQVRPYVDLESLPRRGNSCQPYAAVQFRNSIPRNHGPVPKSFQINQLFGLKCLRPRIDATEFKFMESSAFQPVPRNSAPRSLQQVPASSNQAGSALSSASSSSQSVGWFCSRPCDESSARLQGGDKDINELLASLQKHGCDILTDTSNLHKHSPYHDAEGGCGYIFRGMCGGDEVAIKCPRITRGHTGSGKRELLERAAYESLVWWQCDHPNIQKLIGVAQLDHQFAMISPWMPFDLWQYITRYRPSPEARCVLSAPICDAVAYLHRLKIVHGDIKASNVLLSENLTPKLADFGSAIMKRFSVPNREPIVSLRWMPLEMLEEGAKPTPQSDAHSLGMTILEIFTGLPPYSGVTDKAVMTHIVFGSLPERPDQLPTGNKRNDSLWALLVRCWAPEPSTRLPAGEVGDQLKSIFEE